jgi:hypothetical protein
MGEYFNWVNVDRGEYICPSDFDYGSKYHESMHIGNTFLKALRTLLSAEWKGCHILFLGDEGENPEKSSIGVLASLQKQTELYKGHYFDMICETYRNVSCLFREAESIVREEIGYYLEDYRRDPNNDLPNEYGIDIENPFDGLFLRTGRDFRYTINETKKTYYSIGLTKVYNSAGIELLEVDPLPMLMGYGRVAEPALWLGDIICVSDELRPGYALLQEVHLQSW